MLRLATDADVDGAITRGLLRRLPEINLVTVQDVLPEGAPDQQILAWAAVENRIVVTNDRSTMTDLASERVAAGEPVPGLIVVSRLQSIGSAIDDILLIVELMPEDEIRDRVVVYLPLRQ
jgi:predicted nuclease of predicted toxin-antitoxin system